MAKIINEISPTDFFILLNCLPAAVFYAATVVGIVLGGGASEGRFDSGHGGGLRRSGLPVDLGHRIVIVVDVPVAVR